MENDEKKELSRMLAILIDTTNSQGEGIVVVGDSGASICLIQEMEVSRNKLKVLSRNKETATKGIGKNGIIKCKGTVENPNFIEGHMITIHRKVCRDDDMPTGKHVEIGNSHQLVRKTKIDFENLVYHTLVMMVLNFKYPSRWEKCSLEKEVFQSALHIKWNWLQTHLSISP